MLQFDVTVPGFGEAVALTDGQVIVGDGKQVAVTLTNEEGPLVAFMIPADVALALSRGIYQAARHADPERTSLIGQLRASAAGNA